MAVKQIDLGEVVGPKGDTGPKGIQDQKERLVL